MKIIVECQPRNVDITAVEAKKYAGQPRTIKQENNYAREAVALSLTF